MGTSGEQREKEGSRLCPSRTLLKMLSELMLSTMFLQQEEGVKGPVRWDGRSDSQANLKRSYKGALNGKLPQVI